LPPVGEVKVVINHKRSGRWVGIKIIFSLPLSHYYESRKETEGKQVVENKEKNNCRPSC